MDLIGAGMVRARTCLSLLLLLLVAGAVSFRDIPKESSPDINIPIIYTSVSLEGISPEDSERLLVKPLEQVLASIEGVKEMRSTGYQGGANIVLEFEAGFDADKALDDAREQVDKAKSDLPGDADDPTVSEVNFSLFPVLLITLSGNVQGRHLLNRAEQLQDRIESLPQILEVGIRGEREEVVELNIDPYQLEAYNLTSEEVFSAVRSANVLVAAGSVRDGSGQFSVKLPGLVEAVSQLETLPLRVDGESVLMLKDITSIRRTFKDERVKARLNGESSLTLRIVKRTGENVIDTISAVRAIVDQEAGNWNDGVRITFSQDRSEDIRRMLNDLRNNIVSAILLVMIVILAVLGIRAGLLVGISIPGAFLTAIMFLYIGGMTVNVVVLFALIMSVGLLVDGAIVVVEFAERQMSEGLSTKESYLLASRRMAWPIIASTATTLAAFMPLLFWPGVVGEFMYFLPLTLIITLAASLAMALFFVPILGTYFATSLRVLIVIVSALFGLMLGRALLGALGLPAPLGIVFGLVLAFFFARYAFRRVARRLVSWLDVHHEEHEGPIQSGRSAFTQRYVAVLDKCLDRPGRVLGYAGLILILSWGMYAVLGRGVEFFPNVEPETAALLVHARGNLSVDERDRLVRQVEQIVVNVARRDGEIKSVASSSGFVNLRGENAQDIIGEILIDFAEWNERRPARQIIRELRMRTAQLSGIDVEPRIEQAGPPRGKPVSIQLGSDNLDLLNQEARRVDAYIRTVDGLINHENTLDVPGFEWVLQVDRAEAAKFGADIGSIGRFVRLVTNGLKISTYRPDDSDNEVDIVLRLPEDERNIQQLDTLRVNTRSGPVPFSNFVERLPSPKTGLIRRTGQQRTVLLEADIRPGILADDKTREIRRALPELGIAPGVRVEFKGEDEDQREARAFLSKAFGIALFLMGLILLTQFNSFYQCLLILSAVVMSTTGVMLGLLIVRQPFGIIMCGIGVISLAGIVVNNNIVLINTFNYLYKKTGNLREAILETGAQRLRPVLLTTVTTILGLMPMVLATNIDFFARTVEIGAPSTQFWQQLATSIAFGLGFATVLTLFVTPSALMLTERFEKRKAGTPAKRTPRRRSVQPAG